MSDHFVVDASVAIAWVHPAQATTATESLLQKVAGGAVVEAPALWPLETANALLVLARRGKIHENERLAALAALAKLGIKIDHEAASVAWTKLSTLALKTHLSIYDAAYLELARRRRLPLACRDASLQAAAIEAGVAIL